MCLLSKTHILQFKHMILILLFKLILTRSISESNIYFISEKQFDSKTFFSILRKSIGVTYLNYVNLIDDTFFSLHIEYLPYKCVSLVLEDANLLNGTKMCECLLQQVLWKATGDSPTIYRTIGRTWLVINFVKGQRLGICCKRKWENVTSS